MITFAGLAMVACNGDNIPVRDQNAALLQSCGPTDGPAVTLVLTDQPASAEWPAPPYSAITVYRALGDVVGRHFDFNQTITSGGQAFVCPAVGDCEAATSASVTFGTFKADSTIAASYRIVAPSGSLRGSALARYHPLSMLCG
jgi:hypothetical protein